MSRSLSTVVLVSLCGAVPTVAGDPPAPAPTSSLHGLPFQPFDAGPARPVTRGGQRGVGRRPHPHVGEAGHIPGGGQPRAALRGDPDLPELAGTTPNAAPGLSANPLFLAALFYANFLTRTDGPRCQHLPTCSRFASQAVARHGVLGIPMGLDRVIQPPMSSALRPLPDVEYGEIVRHFDPLENYEFWVAERFTGFPPPIPEEPPVPATEPFVDGPAPPPPLDASTEKAPVRP